MHLVTPLMTGVRGAKNGTVFCYERGTETPAPVYADASGKVRRHGVVRLDALGSVALYVDRLVDLVVYSSSHALVRAWTDGRADGAVVVENDAFTGVDYETGQPGIGERTTLAEALSRWFESGGAIDFNVLFHDDSAPLHVAIGDTAGAFYDVRDFGAVGDNVGDDLGPIQAAIETARGNGGGVVYLPAGTYRISDSISLYEEVSLAGAGCSCTFLVMTNELVPALVMLGSNDPVSVSPTHSLSGIYLSCDLASVLLSSQPLVQMNAGSAVMFDCCVDGVYNTGDLVLVGPLQRVRIYNCFFKVVGAASRGVSTFFPGPSVTYMNVENCIFYSFGTQTAGSGLVGINNMHVEGCTFDLGNMTSGDVECVVLSGNVNGSVDGCNVGDIAGGGNATLLVAGSLFDSFERLFEDCCLMDSVTTSRLYALTDTGNAGAYYSRVKTIEARHSPVYEVFVATNNNQIFPIAPDTTQYGIFSAVSKSTVATVPADVSSVLVGTTNSAAYISNMNQGRPIDLLFFCVTSESFNMAENIYRNSVVPRWTFKANSLFAFRLISLRARANLPTFGDMTRLHCLFCSASPATVVLGEREGYGPI